MIENYVTSFVEGRIRLRHPIFKDEQIVAQVQNIVSSIDGFEAFTSNLKTGSILLQYDEEVITQETLLELLKQGSQFLDFEGYVPEPKPTKEKACCLPACFSNMSTKDRRRIFNRTMATALGVTALAIGVGNKRIHILAGSVFLGLSVVHIKRMQKAIF